MAGDVIQGCFPPGARIPERMNALPPVMAGSPLPPAVRQKMESFFGTSFADVRVHVGPQAAAIGALAFTRGSHIHFAPGQYDPHLPRGQRILGHELAHVVQQRAGRVRNPFGAGVAVVRDPRHEAEAGRASRLAPLHAPPPPGPARVPVVQGHFPRGVNAAAPALAAALRTPRTAGQPLPPAVRQKMEARFGTSFADVRVHVGQHVAAAGATAFTRGAEIHFAPGHYQPSTMQGQRALARELAHVVQQRAGRVRNPFGAAVVRDRALDAEAERMAARAAAPPRPVVQRMLATTSSSVVSTGTTAPYCPANFMNVTLPTCALTPEAQLSALEMQYAIVAASGGPSMEKFYAMGRIENEMRLLREEMARANEFNPGPDAPTFGNHGSWKDWVNAFSTGLWRYHDNPTSIAGVEWLHGGTQLRDGYYAYAYRVSDNKIAVFYTGTDSHTNNAVPHSYLASGGRVYSAGMMAVRQGEIVSIDSASGHYLPDPSNKVDWETCQTYTTTMVPLENTKKRIEDLGLDVSHLDLRPFSHPGLVGEMIDCGADRMRRQGLRFG